MRTYSELFRTPQFTPLFVATWAHPATVTLNGLALATLVYASTGSPLLAAVMMFGPSFAHVIGATTLLSLADRVPPRASLVLIALATGAGSLVLAVPAMPLPVMFGVVFALALITSVAGGIRYGLLSQILPPGGYTLGRSVFNISSAVMQILGYALGGVLLTVLPARTVLVVSAGVAFASAIVLRFGLRRWSPRASGHPSIAVTWRVDRELLSTPARRAVYLAMWVPNGLIVGCEALFVPYDPSAAAALFVAAVLAMLVGDLTAGRLIPQEKRWRLIIPLLYLLAAPYLLFVLPLGAPVAVGLVAVASIGFASTLLLQERLIALVGEDIRGQALGLQASGMLALQAVGATLAGVTAEHLPVGWAMAIMAAASLIVTTALIPGLRLAQPAPEELAAAHGTPDRRDTA